MKAPARIKITKRGFELYTGHLGPVHFTNGVSDDVVAFQQVNRIAASLEVAYLDEDGKELPAGAAVALMENATTRASDVETLERQTEEERTREDRARVVASEKAPVEVFYTEEELQKVADGGIKPLREIAKPWGVKGRAIPELIREILEAQVRYVKDRDQRREAVGLPAASIVTDVTNTGEPEVEAPTPEREGQGEGEATPGAAELDAARASIADAINQALLEGSQQNDEADEASE